LRAIHLPSVLSLRSLRVQTGKEEAVKILLEQGSNPNVISISGRDTPLHFAALNGNVSAILHLIEAGAALHVVNSREQRPVDIARELQNKEAEVILRGPPARPCPLVNRKIGVDSADFDVIPPAYPYKSCFQMVPDEGHMMSAFKSIPCAVHEYEIFVGKIGESDPAGEGGVRVRFPGDRNYVSVAGLLPSTKYVARVRGRNRCGWGVFSKEVSFVTFDDVPFVGSAPTIIGMAGRQIFMRFHPPRSNGPPLLETRMQKVELREEIRSDTYSMSLSTLEERSSRQKYLYQIIPVFHFGTPVKLTVCGRNSAGWGEYGPNVFGISVSRPALESSSPRTLVVSWLTPYLNRVALRQDTKQGGAIVQFREIDYFSLECKQMPSGEWKVLDDHVSIFSEDCKCMKRKHIFPVENLQPNTGYIFRMSPHASVDSDIFEVDALEGNQRPPQPAQLWGTSLDYPPSNVFMTTTGPPDPVPLPRLISHTTSLLVLEWKPPADNGDPLIGYRLRWRMSDASEKLREDDNVGETIRKCLKGDAAGEHGGGQVDIMGRDFLEAQQGQGIMSFAISGLFPGCAYIANICAVNSLGDGAWNEDSAEFWTNAVPTPKPPILLHRSACSISVQWTDPSREAVTGDGDNYALGGVEHSQATKYELQMKQWRKSQQSADEVEWAHVYTGMGEGEESSFELLPISTPNPYFRISELDSLYYYTFRVRQCSGFGWTEFSASSDQMYTKRRM